MRHLLLSLAIVVAAATAGAQSGPNDARARDIFNN
jgi:hypothetical protein